MEKSEDITFFRRKFFVSQCRKKTWRNPSVLKRNSRDDNFHANEGGITVFLMLLSDSTEKNRRSRHCVSQMLWYVKENYS